MKPSPSSPKARSSLFQFPEEVTVSRMSQVRPPSAGSLKKPRKRVTEYRYGHSSIEQTLSLRQRLQPTLKASSSEPSLGSSAAPEITTIGGRQIGAGGPLAAASALAVTGASPAGKQPPHWASASRPSLRSGAHGGGGDAAQDAWCGLLGGGRQVAVPFNRLGYEAKDVDKLVHWYRGEVEETKHQNSAMISVRKGDNMPVVKRLTPWAALAQEAHAKLKASPGSLAASKLEMEVDLYERLMVRMPAQGPAALVEAMVFKAGSVEKVFKLLDFNGNGEVSLMEFAGGLSLMGLDVEALTGMQEGEVFRLVDVDGSGVLELEELMAKARMRDQPTRRAKTPHHDLDDEQIREAEQARREDLRIMAKWGTMAKWMATATRRSQAYRENRLRRGWKATGESGPEGKKPGTPNPRLESTPADVLMETASMMREYEKEMRALFIKASSLRDENGVQQMTREDAYAFFKDMNVADPHRSRDVSEELLETRFDEAQQLQIESTQIGGGLLFWSFKALLNNVISDIGLGWPGLVELSVSSQMSRRPSK